MNIRFTTAALAFMLVCGTTALAGPPLICHPIAIQGALSLPWNDAGGWNGMLPSYDTAHLSTDTLDLLNASAPVEVRMETMRRAAIYASRDPQAGQRLLTRLLARTRGREVPETALFDAGYFAEALREAAEAHAMIRNTTPN